MVSREEKNKYLEEDIKKEEKKEKRKKITAKIIKIVIIIIILISSIFIYMHFVGTKGLKVKEYKVESNKLPDSFTGFKIVHFSDLYYLTTINEKEMKNVVKKINELKPDIVVFTGDLIDNTKDIEKNDTDFLIKQLNKIDAKIGKYAIKGEQDYTNAYNQVMSKTNFKVISNSYELIYYKGNTPILLTGMNSCIKKNCDSSNAFSFNEIDNLYTISLIHEPDALKDIINNKPDLVLAGHSLNGQIRLPLIGGLIKQEYANNYNEPKYEIKNTKLFISGGLGTNKYEFRLFNHPSINFYRLVKETK